MDGSTARPLGDPLARQKLGRVVSISGSQVVLLLDDAPSLDTALPLQIGALVRMRTGLSTVYGLVSAMSVPIPASQPGEREMRIVEMELVGEAPDGEDGAPLPFRRGISVYPSLGDEVFTSTREDLQQVYVRPGRSTVRIGTVHQDRTLPASVITDDLLAKHFAVLGTTGSGKSCAVTLLLKAILAQHSHGHVILLDPHAEYASAFGDQAELIDPRTLELPYWLLTFDEIHEIISGESIHREAEGAILGDLILSAKRRYVSSGGGDDYVTVDTPVPYRLNEIGRLLEEAMGKLEKAGDLAPYFRIRARLDALQGDRRYSFMFPAGISVRDNMTAILRRLFRLPVEGRPITIVDLSGVPSEILNVVVSVLTRMAFDFALWNDRAVPILLVCEEAHRYAPNDSRLGFEPTKRSLARIAKEGRKYGVSLGVVSQRPSELATDMLSQCNTIFAMRMTNQHDQEFVRAALSEWAHGLLDFLPSLGNGEAVAVGEGVPVPVRVAFDELPAGERPSRGGASFSAAWQEDHSAITDLVQHIVERWRRQRR